MLKLLASTKNLKIFYFISWPTCSSQGPRILYLEVDSKSHIIEFTPIEQMHTITYYSDTNCVRESCRLYSSI